MSREKKFTPGPWFTGIRGTLRTITKCIIAVGHNKICDLLGPDTEEQKANANLIAAAPELLEALEAFIDVKSLKDAPGVIQSMNSAIKKAYGETE